MAPEPLCSEEREAEEWPEGWVWLPLLAQNPNSKSSWLGGGGVVCLYCWILSRRNCTCISPLGCVADDHICLACGASLDKISDFMEGNMAHA